MAVDTTLEFLNDANGRQTFARKPSVHVDARVLGIATRESYTLPSGAKFVIFSANGDFYAKPDDGASNVAVPGADVTDGTAGELNPLVWNVEGATSIGLIAPAACIVTMAVYK
jgi:hypothetical protein